MFASRDWNDEQWTAAHERPLSRGWIDESGQATDRGREIRDAVERRTDELAAGPWRSLQADTAALARLLGPVFERAIGAGVLPTRSTFGIGMRFGNSLSGT